METPTPVASSNPGSMSLWIIGAIVVIGIIIVFMNMDKSTDNTSEKTKSDITVEEETLANEETVVTPTTLVKSTDPDQALLYTTALQKYAGRRVEFSTRCQVSPVKATFKSGTKVMLDNRGSEMNKIAVGDKMFEIPAYNFAFITLESDSLPAIYPVSCGANRGVASITITK